MSALLRLRIGQRLSLAFGLVLFLLACTAGLALRHLGVIRDELDSIVQVNDAEYQLVAQMRIAADGLVQQAGAVIMLDDIVAMKAARAEFDQDLARYDAAEKKLGALFAGDPGTSEREKGLFAQIGRQQDALDAPLRKSMDLAMTNQNMDAGKLMASDAFPAQRALFASMDDLLKYEDQLNQEALAQAHDVYSKSRAMVLSLAVAAIALAAAAGWLITRSIVVPIGEAVRAAERVAAGDLTQPLRAPGRDETSQLLRAMSTMQDKLSQVVARVRDGADSVATASSQIAQGNNDLSGRTEQQASALEETAASMEELAATVRHNADNARQADQLAQGTSNAAATGGQVVGEVVATMRDIQESSRRIADIIGVIDGIAFQTNILALNAAVEAARAGEQGRGFAVVAGEVRGLAQRSAAAAREIKSLITSSVERIEQGSALADRAGGTMDEIVGGIRRVTDLMGEISVASAQQSRGVVQVGEAVTQMDKGTQQNAAMVEEMAAAAASLRTRAAELVAVVNVFRIDEARHA